MLGRKPFLAARRGCEAVLNAFLKEGGKDTPLLGKPFSQNAIDARLALFKRIADYAANLPQPALVRLGIRYRQRGCYIPPSHPTLRRTLRAVNTHLLDTVVSDWLWRQARRGAFPVAAVRRLALAAGTPEATGEDGTPLRLFARVVAGLERRG